ncbi:MAG: rRNA maturation RNase YbeY [Schleiferiaceae bacterium]
MAIRFDFPRIPGFTKKQSAEWLFQVALSEGASIERLTYKAFGSKEMIALNMQFLNHDYDTDIITFAESEAPLPISADFALGWDQIALQSRELGEPLVRELHRILVHGLLHCIGYDDRTEEQRLKIRAKEDYYLATHPECSTWN